MTLGVLRTADGARAWVERARAGGASVALVPTQGCLHEGHASIMRAARRRGDAVLATVFVNPLQFYPEGYRAYPRTPERDLEIARDAGCAGVFAPDVDAVYPGAPGADGLLALAHTPHPAPDPEAFTRGAPIGDGTVSLVRVPSRLSMRLDGRLHPWHFDGVATVVARLLDITRPDRAWFGRKDLQQLAILRALNEWLGLGIEIASAPIVREPDGVASSSRLTQLDADGRAAAARLACLLLAHAQRVEGGERDLRGIGDGVRRAAAGMEGVEIESVDVVHPETLEPIEWFEDAGAVYAAYTVRCVRLQECVYLGDSASS